MSTPTLLQTADEPFTDLTFDKRLSCYILKIGGSVTTNKSGRYELLDENIQLIAKTIHQCFDVLEHPLILVFGGGSFGNVAPKDYNIADPQGDWQNVDLPMMTLTMFSMLQTIANIFRQNKVPVYPIQTSAIAHFSAQGSHLHTGSIEMALRAGNIPLLTGDLVFDTKRHFRILSSDCLPVMLADTFNVQNVLYYCNVPGVYYPQGTDSIVKLVNHANFDQVLTTTGPSNKPDITGGMKTKLQQLRLLAQKGVGSEIIDFVRFKDVRKSLDNKVQFGTRICHLPQEEAICL
jgi:isopentenyl phosphate kinase